MILQPRRADLIPRLREATTAVEWLPALAGGTKARSTATKEGGAHVFARHANIQPRIRSLRVLGVTLANLVAVHVLEHVAHRDRVVDGVLVRTLALLPHDMPQAVSDTSPHLLFA